MEAKAVLLQVMLEIFANATINEDEGSGKHKATKLAKRRRREEGTMLRFYGLLLAVIGMLVIGCYWHTRLISRLLAIPNLKIGSKSAE